MNLLARAGFLLVFALKPATASAQLGEVQVGVIGSYGTRAVLGRGVGLVGGVAAGRVVYSGLRWVYHAGSADQQVHVFGFDAGLMIPAGSLEIVPGATFGATLSSPSNEKRDLDFLAAPGIAVHAHVAGLVVIPELQYYTRKSAIRGLVASVRLVVPIEVDRIRH